MEVLSYLFYSIYFVIAILFAFFIPGNLLVKNFKLSRIANFSSSIILGLCIWALQGFILGYLNLRFLTYLYLVIMLIAWLKLNPPLLTKVKNFRPKTKLMKENALIIGIFLIGVSLQILMVIGNAIPVKEGLMFCCGGADALYHGALAKELATNFPPNEPGIANYTLKNYHFLSNLVVAELVRIFKLPLLASEYLFIPILMSILFGLSAYTLATILKLGKNFTIFFLFLVFFFSDIFYILTLITNKKLIFNVETIETSLSLWVSYTRYFGVVIFFQALSFLILWLKNRTVKFLIPLLLTGGLLIGFKVYIGLLFLAGAGALMLYFIFKKEFNSFLSILLLFALSAFVYLPVSSSSGGLVFTGFWKTRDFIVNPNLNLMHLELARRIFEQAGNSKKYFFDLLFFAIFIIFSFGILLTSFLNPPKNLRRLPKELHIFLIASFISTFIIAMFFIQKTGGANSSQFLISVFLIGAIYSALFLDYLFDKKKWIFKILVVTLLLITIPKTTHIVLTKLETIRPNHLNTVTTNNLKAYNYINDNLPANSIFVVHPKLVHSCLYLPLLTHAKSYYCESASPVDRAIDTKKYEREVSAILKSKKELGNKQFDYILSPSDYINGKNQKTIFKNSSLKILKYEKNPK
jgi:hypothetical protein